MKNYESDIFKKHKEMEALQESLAAAEAEMSKIRDGLRGKTDKFQSALDEKKQELVPWNEKINGKQSEISVKESQLLMIEERMNAETNALAEIQQSLATQQSIAELKRKEIKELEKQLALAKMAAEDLRASLDAMSAKESQLRTSLIEVNQEKETIDAALNADAGRDELIKVLAKEKKIGKLPGFFGRLGELGEIDPRYDVAISSAFFESLKWIVVDTVSTAEKCLQILKAKNLGRASFIVLERTTDAKENVATPENAARLVDLVQPQDPKFRRAFYYVLRDTLVAEDLDQANRIAFGKIRWKVVTLDGKVIDKAGTMSGGGNRVVRGGMRGFKNAEFSPEDLAKISQQKSRLESELKACREELKMTEAKHSEALADIPAIEDKLSCAQMDLSTAEKQIENLKKKASEIRYHIFFISFAGVCFFTD